MQELEADPHVVAHADRDFAHIGVDRFAEIRDGVDERHLRGEERVRCVLDHLRRRRVGHEHRSVNASIELRDPHRRLRVFAADDDAIRMQEIVHRLAFAEELRIGGDRDVLTRGTGLGQHALHELR